MRSAFWNGDLLDLGKLRQSFDKLKQSVHKIKL